MYQLITLTPNTFCVFILCMLRNNFTVHWLGNCTINLYLMRLWDVSPCTMGLLATLQHWYEWLNSVLLLCMASGLHINHDAWLMKVKHASTWWQSVSNLKIGIVLFCPLAIILLCYLPLLLFLIIFWWPFWFSVNSSVHGDLNYGTSHFSTVWLN